MIDPKISDWADKRMKQLLSDHTKYTTEFVEMNEYYEDIPAPMGIMVILTYISMLYISSQSVSILQMWSTYLFSTGCIILVILGIWKAQKEYNDTHVMDPNCDIDKLYLDQLRNIVKHEMLLENQVGFNEGVDRTTNGYLKTGALNLGVISDKGYMDRLDSALEDIRNDKE